MASCNKSSAVAEMGDNRRGPKIGWGGGCALFSGGSWVLIEHKVAWVEAYLHTKWILVHPAVWPQRTLAENWGAVPVYGGGAGSPSNTKSPGLRPASIPSGILMHTAVWPQ